LVDIVLAHSEFCWKEHSSDTDILRDRPKAFAQDHELASWDIELLDRLANDLLRNTVGVDVRGIPCVETTVVGSLE